MQCAKTLIIKFSGYIILVFIIGHPASAQVSDRPVLPAVFAPGVVSTPFIDAAASFSPDSKTVYFCQGTKYLTICKSEFRDDKWNYPEVLPFSGKWKDWDPFISPDGKQLFFVSNRPLSDTSKANGAHLWYADRYAENKWSPAMLVKAAFNKDGTDNYAPTVGANHTLYFCSIDRDGHKGMGSFSAAWSGDHFDQAVYLPLNRTEETMDPFIAPDERYIIFASGNDLYVSYRDHEQWSPGQKLNSVINNGDANSNPYLSHDGKTLYYTSSRIRGFYERGKTSPPLNYIELQSEMNSIFNGRPNILMIPFQLPGSLK